MSEEKFIKVTIKRVKKFDEKGKVSNDIEGAEVQIVDKFEDDGAICLPLSQVEKVLIGYDSIQRGVSVSIGTRE